ncbi:MAG: hypothetical protein [Caudoviricetes sp.]|nr:MAG: hypothetical protein [Caudoviricetes sp.]
MLQSPGIETKEVSLTSTIARSSTGRAAMVGKFEWGPVNQIMQITSEVDLVDRVGAPTNGTADHFFSAVNFLQYGNDLRLIRVVDETHARNASALMDSVNYKIESAGISYVTGETVRVMYAESASTVEIAKGTITEVGPQGELVSVFVPADAVVKKARETGQYPGLSSSWSVELPTTGVNGNISLGPIIDDSKIYFANDGESEGALTREGIGGNASFRDLCKKMKLPLIAAKFPGEYANNLEVRIVSYKDYTANKGNVSVISYPSGNKVAFNLRSYIEFGPQNENQFAYILLRDGQLTESKILSLKAGDKDIYGSNIYVGDFFQNSGSQFIQASGQDWPKDFSGSLVLTGGKSANDTVTAGNYTLAWDQFSDREQLYVNLLIAGNVAGESVKIASEVQRYVAMYIANTRKDCLALISPPRELLINKSSSDAYSSIIEWRTGFDSSGDVVEDNLNVDSSYIEIDGNYKFQYDKYNDVSRWLPLAGDIAGLCANTDTVGQPWMSPAGFNRGQISGVIKLAFEARQAQRDGLYSVGINPVVGFPGQGFVLFGDKTGTQVPSPFDRINVRRLFNLLKKSIGDRAKGVLFELNDAFTRSAFRSEVTAYMDTIRSLGGMYDFRVICDETNNTPTIVDRNEFVATIYVKPARSINFITLNLVATETGANFDEIIGRQQ